MWPFRRRAAGGGSHTAAIPVVDVREAYRRARKGGRLVDVRSAAEFSTGHPRLAVSAPPKLVKQGGTGLQPGDELLVICQSGHRSLRVARLLAERGFTNVTNVSGGLLAWRNAGLPVDK